MPAAVLRSSHTLLFLLLAFLSATAPLMAQGMSGHTAGQFQVNESGAATYTIPITVPPGTAGIEPKFAMSYSSQGRDSLLGMGWSLSGLSAISRCPATLAQDGFTDGVDFDADDRFCLDGERLMAISGIYGADATEYRTEQDTFRQIISYGQAGSGPSSFTVKTKSGLTMQYGGTIDSLIEAQGKPEALFWAVNRISDTKGNYLSVTYEEVHANGEYRPIRVDYTANDGAGLSAYASVRFVYENRPDITTRYLSGALLKSTKRLKTIQAFEGEQLYREYRLAYEQSPATGTSRLISITECGSDGTCFAPTTFTWTDGENVLSPAGHTTGASFYLSNGKVRSHPGDFNGDGLTDLIATNDDGISNNVFLANGDGTFLVAPQIHDILELSNGTVRIHPGDFDGDGLSDFLRTNSDGVTNNVFFSSGDGTFTVDPEIHEALQNSIGTIRIHTGDFNGDGLTDFLRTHDDSVTQNVFFSNGDGTFLIGPEIHDTLELSNGAVRILPADFNGDGRSDFLRVNNDGVTNNVFFSNGNGTFAVGPPINDIIHRTSGAVRSHLGDFNGDGLADLLRTNNDGVTNNVFLSRGDGTFLIGPEIHDVLLLVNGAVRVQSGDFNGDGFSDFLRTHNDGITNNVFFSNGDGTFGIGPEIHEVLQDSTNTVRLHLGDFNGDGKPDMFRGANGPTDNFLWFTGNLGIADSLLATITTGHGHNTTITYKPLTDGSVYTKDTGATYPQRDFQGPIHVVSAYATSNSIGSSNSFSYHYGGAKINLHGRGFRGFDRTTVTDEQTGIATTVFYDRRFECISSKIRRTEQRQPGGTLIGEVDNTIEVQDHGFGVHFSYVSESVAKRYELDGNLVSTVTTTTNYGDFGNVLSLTVDYGEGFTEAVVNSYEDDLSNWFLGRLTRTEATKTAPGQPTQTRTSAFEYDPVSGLLTKEIVEPDHPASRLEKTYQHDAFGNILTSTTSGPAIASRTHTTVYDAQGRYVVQSTNALGHSEVKTYQLGSLVDLTGPNQLTTSWTYDGFGRQKSELRANGTETLSWYLPCDSSCPANATYYVQSITTGAPERRVFFNRLDQEVRQQTQGFDGTPIWIDTQYNVRGLVARVSDPYFMGNVPLWTILAYDLLGRPVTGTAPFDRITTTSYAGRTTTVTNPLNQANTRTVDARGQLVRSIDNLEGAVTYSYDAFGSMVTMTDPFGNTTTLTYDIRGNKTSIADPDTSTTTFTYNTLGELTSQTDSNGNTVTVSYDALGRITSRTEPEGTSTWIYDTRPKGISKLSGVSRGEYAREYFYDALGRPTETRTTIGAESFSLTTLYDLFGRPDTLVYPTGFGVRTTYNAFGHASEVRRLSGNALIWQADRVNARGQLEQATLGNGLATTRTFDPETGTVDAIQTGTVQHLAFGFDVIGNLLSRSDQLRGLSESFTYDGLNRLTSSQVAGQAAVSVAYDALGNITSKSDVGTYTYGENDAGPHAVTSIAGVKPNSYTYDASGNRISSTAGTIAYTSFNKPHTITEGAATVTFDYGPEYARYCQTATTGGPITTTLYVGGVFERKTIGSVMRDIHYIRAGGQTVAVYTAEDTGAGSLETTRYLHRDHLGSLQVITDELGNAVEFLSFDPWGNRRKPEDWTPAVTPIVSALDRGFTGHEHLDDLGLIHMNGRVYDPVMGRFLSADPFIQAPEFSQSLNRYSYVLNNPLSLTDPSGFFFKSFFRGIRHAIKSTVSFVEDNGYTITQLVGIATGNPSIIVGTSFAVSFHAGIQSGAGFGDALISGIKSGAISAATLHASSLIRPPLPLAARVIAHGVIQGTARAATGGQFEHGFIAGAFAEFGFSLFGPIGGIVAAGTAEELGGGKFANGALSAAMMHVASSIGQASRNSSEELLSDIPPDITANKGIEPPPSWTREPGAADPSFCVECVIVDLASLWPPIRAFRVAIATQRITRSGLSGVSIIKSNRVLDITPSRVKEFVPEMRAVKKWRPVIFKDAIPGTKGKKRLPTQKDLDLLRKYSNDGR